MNIIYIYCLKDPETGNIRYIGKTTNIEIRLKAHITRSRYNTYHSARWIQSILKKGLRPIIEIIEKCDENTWIEREIFWISYYKEKFDLTNILDGGEGGATFGRLGKPWTDEQRENNKKARKGKSVNHTKEGNENRAEGIRRYYEKNKRKVYQYDLNGNFIKEWDCAINAGVALKINSSNIHKICKTQKGRTGKYIWSYLLETELCFIESIKKNNKKSIYQLNINNEIINDYTSITEASKITKISTSAIKNNLSGLSKSAGGYKWKYKEII